MTNATPPPPVPSVTMRDGPLFAVLAFVVAAAVMIGSSLAVAVVAAILYAIADPNQGPAALTAKLQGISVLLPTLFLSQIGLLVVTLVAWRLTRKPFRSRLGLTRPRVTAFQGVAIVLAGGVPFAVAILAASVMPTFSDPEAILSLWANTPLPLAIVWVVMIGVLPGCIEELAFRGLLQPAFAQRLRPWLAILVTTILFALLHVDPAAMAVAFVLGLWLGWIAWRTGSILLGIATHLVVNSGWNAGQMIARQLDLAEETVVTALAPIAIISLAAFVYAVVVLVRDPHRRADAAIETT